MEGTTNAAGPQWPSHRLCQNIGPQTLPYQELQLFLNPLSISDVTIFILGNFRRPHEHLELTEIRFRSMMFPSSTPLFIRRLIASAAEFPDKIMFNFSRCH
ncbi:unnamed protein product [Arabidopsis lyrata]|nr:unnamed protein product [Arabidopsis lyrata]